MVLADRNVSLNLLPRVPSAVQQPDIGWWHILRTVSDHVH